MEELLVSKMKIKKEYYDNGELRFEGEYLKGKIWNGKGKEFNAFSGKQDIEVEYINGKVFYGKVKKYYKDGCLVFKKIKENDDDSK